MITSTATKTVLSLLGQLVKTARQQRGMSQKELGQRLDASRQTIIALEKGDAQVSIGTVFEAAHIVGIPLLSDDKEKLNQWQAILSGFTSLLPKRIHSKKVEIDNDF
ncbi:MAG: XRE family transcriptional regulator [Gammaproteobacteria bacterium]|nr:XRE family transcriptional regulator [Gammaproteobacteria bacterium]